MHLISTLGALQSEGFTVTAHCGNCQHSRKLDLVALVDRLGADFVAIGDPNPLAAKLKCDRCGTKLIGLILAPPSVPTPGLGLYGKSAS